MIHARRYAVVITALLAISGALLAADPPRFAACVDVTREKDGTAYVILNGRKAIHLQKSNGTLKPADRAKIIADRLSKLLPAIADPKAITSKDVGAESQLLVSGTLVAIATADEAKARSTTPSKLAAMWVDNLRKLLAAPPITVEPSSLLVPLGEKRTVTVKVFVPGEIGAEVSDGSIIRADSTVKTGSLVVEGLAAGSAIIKVKCQSHEVSVPVSVKKYAASVAGVGKTAITGRGVPSSLVLRAVRDVINSTITLEPGAVVRKMEIPQSVHVPAQGRTSTVTATIVAEGPEYIAAKLQAPVEVENRPVPKAEPADIWFSNYPETVTKYQVLFTGKLAVSEESTRLLYHHYNDMPQSMGFVIDVINPGAQPAELHLIEGVSEPMVDVVIVGYVAGKEFINSRRDNLGRIVTIPPGTRRVLVSQSVPHPKTASGIMEFRQLSGDPLVVRLVAKPDDQRAADDPTGVGLALAGFDPSRIAYSDGVFPRPQKTMDVNYTVGKQWAFIRLGKNPIKHETLDKSLFAFGITYDVNATLENPTDEEKTVEVLFEATAGPAAGVFLLDGKYSEVKRLGPPDEREIGRFTLKPGQTRKTNIRTIPLSGSAYPATIIIRAAK